MQWELHFFFIFHKVPKQALTVGVGTVMDSREVMILITGAHKAYALHMVNNYLLHYFSIFSPLYFLIEIIYRIFKKIHFFYISGHWRRYQSYVDSVSLPATSSNIDDLWRGCNFGPQSSNGEILQRLVGCP